MRAIVPKYLAFFLMENTLDLFCTGPHKISMGENQWKETIATLRTHLQVEQSKNCWQRSRSLVSNIGTRDTLFYSHCIPYP